MYPTSGGASPTLLAPLPLLAPLSLLAPLFLLALLLSALLLSLSPSSLSSQSQSQARLTPLPWSSSPDVVGGPFLVFYGAFAPRIPGGRKAGREGRGGRRKGRGKVRGDFRRRDERKTSSTHITREMLWLASYSRQAGGLVGARGGGGSSVRQRKKKITRYDVGRWASRET